MNKTLHETYMRWGRAALDHCKWTFVIGAGNKHDDLARTGGWAAESVRRMRQGSTATSIAELAAEAEAARCGNCGEQAAAAYEYLRTRFAARPLDCMVLNPTRGAIHNGPAGVCDGDHVYVLIGRTRATDVRRQDWDVEAVVCDPWAGVVCPAYDYTTKGVCGFAWHPSRSVDRVP
jgi:hypothetical protein